MSNLAEFENLQILKNGRIVLHNSTPIQIMGSYIPFFRQMIIEQIKKGHEDYIDYLARKMPDVEAAKKRLEESKAELEEAKKTNDEVEISQAESSVKVSEAVLKKQEDKLPIAKKEFIEEVELHNRIFTQPKYQSVGSRIAAVNKGIVDLFKKFNNNIRDKFSSTKVEFLKFAQNEKSKGLSIKQKAKEDPNPKTSVEKPKVTNPKKTEYTVSDIQKLRDDAGKKITEGKFKEENKNIYTSKDLNSFMLGSLAAAIVNEGISAENLSFTISKEGILTKEQVSALALGIFEYNKLKLTDPEEAERLKHPAYAVRFLQSVIENKYQTLRNNVDYNKYTTLRNAKLEEYAKSINKEKKDLKPKEVMHVINELAQEEYSKNLNSNEYSDEFKAILFSNHNLEIEFLLQNSISNYKLPVYNDLKNDRPDLSTALGMFKKEDTVQVGQNKASYKIDLTQVLSMFDKTPIKTIEIDKNNDSTGPEFTILPIGDLNKGKQKTKKEDDSVDEVLTPREIFKAERLDTLTKLGIINESNQLINEFASLNSVYNSEDLLYKMYSTNKISTEQFAAYCKYQPINKEKIANYLNDDLEKGIAAYFIEKPAQVKKLFDNNIITTEQIEKMIDSNKYEFMTKRVSKSLMDYTFDKEFSDKLKESTKLHGQDNDITMSVMAANLYKHEEKYGKIGKLLKSISEEYPEFMTRFEEYKNDRLAQNNKIEETKERIKSDQGILEPKDITSKTHDDYMKIVTDTTARIETYKTEDRTLLNEMLDIYKEDKKFRKNHEDGVITFNEDGLEKTTPVMDFTTYAAERLKTKPEVLEKLKKEIDKIKAKELQDKKKKEQDKFDKSMAKYYNQDGEKEKQKINNYNEKLAKIAIKPEEFTKLTPDEMAINFLEKGDHKEFELIARKSEWSQDKINTLIEIANRRLEIVETEESVKTR